MEQDTINLEGGFADPVHNAQAAFRALMDAMARPGGRGEVGGLVSPPAPLGVAAGAIACTLMDADTPVWLDPSLQESFAVRAWLGFHTGAALIESMAEARFALIRDAASMPALDRFAQGSQEYPDRSTTLIVEVAALDGGEPLVLRGPGIEGRTQIAPQGLAPGFERQWAENRSRFPRGVDLILTCRDVFLCLPRSARLADLEGR